VNPPAPTQTWSIGRFLWGLSLAAFSIIAGVVLFIGKALSDDSSAVLARLDAAEGGTSGERVVTGTVRPAKDEALLRAPATGLPCVAWETSVEMHWTEKDSDGDDEYHSAVLAQGGEAIAFDVDDARAGLLATVREPRLELLAIDVTGPLERLPPWTARLHDGGASLKSEARLSWRERTLAPGQTVTLVGALAREGPPRMTPGPGQARVTAYQGTPDEWRDEARAMADEARSLHRMGAILAAVSAVMLVGLLRTFLPRRA
jgi:hypothetical protein